MKTETRATATKNYQSRLYQIVVKPDGPTYHIMSDQLGFYRCAVGNVVSPLRHNRTIEAIEEIERRHKVHTTGTYLSIEVAI